MNPTLAFCPNLACPARGQAGKGNIGMHSRKEKRLICRQYGKTFTDTTGTACYRLRPPVETVALVITLLSHGCPLQAIVAAFGFDARTVRGLGSACGQAGPSACSRQVVEQPGDLEQVQADAKHNTKYARKTNHIERFNNTLRQRVSRLVRETLSFSKKLAYHIGALKYFICHYNLAKAAALPV